MSRMQSTLPSHAISTDVSFTFLVVWAFSTGRSDTLFPQIACLHTGQTSAFYIHIPNMTNTCSNRLALTMQLTVPDGGNSVTACIRVSVTCITCYSFPISMHPTAFSMTFNWVLFKQNTSWAAKFHCGWKVNSITCIARVMSFISGW
jgi:hypothetical protein